MGYYTRFKVSTLPPKSEEEIQVLFSEGAARDNFDFATCGEVAKWYDHDEHFLEASTSNPEILFIVDGHGEGYGDVWRKFYRNGKLEKHTWEPPVAPKTL